MKFRLEEAKSGGLALVPFDEAAARMLDEQAELTLAEPVEIELLHRRDMIEHRRIMSQIGDLAKVLHVTHDQLRAELLYATGNFALIGELVGLPPIIAVNSMSRTAMKDHELHTFWDEARETIISRILPRIEDPTERARMEELFSPQPA
jgi:hypothetical protein